MQIILLNDVEKVGKKNQVIKVRDGFGRNYLIPRGFALIANDSNKRILAEKVKQEEIKEQKASAEMQKIADLLKDAVIKVGAKVGVSEKIFGAVTAVQLAEAIKKQKGIEIDRKNITLLEEVKTLGTYKADISLGKNWNVQITFEVVGE
jgi:large subunit ribosomal protein L9